MNAFNVLALFGPTAVGKTKLALELAKTLDLEILNMDSMQIYRELSIGTAKPDAEEMVSVPHHLFNIASIRDLFSVALYRKRAEEVLEDLEGRGKGALFVGGTGLYLSSLYYDFSFRGNLKERISPETLEEIMETEVLAFDRDNPHRLQRFLETGVYHRREERRRSDRSIGILSLERPREELHRRMDQRIDAMIRSGLLEEVEGILAEGDLPDTSPFYKGIGYKEIIPYFTENRPLEECIERLRINTRRYAKRQATWIRNQYPEVLHLDANRPSEELIQRISAYSGEEL